jgi:hypothetical protein
MRPRRVVTGVDTGGASTVVEDAPVDPIEVTSGRSLRIWDLWGSDARITLPSDGAKPAYKRFFPPSGGFRVMTLCFNPEAAGTIDPVAYRAERDELLAGYAEDAHEDPSRTGFHATDTVDVVFVASGEIVLELSNGETTLREGDYLIQNGTGHRWRNRSSQPATIVCFLSGADAAR